MMNRTMALALAMTLLGATAAPARLCRDTRGLFTPCVGDAPAIRHKHRADAPAQGDQAPVETAQRSADAPATEAAPAHASNRTKAPSRHRAASIIQRGKLCRDSRGLFTPCA